MKLEIRSPKAERWTFPWGSWILFLLLCGHLIFCHGCHGEDVDDELCVPPLDARDKESHRRERGERREEKRGETNIKLHESFNG
jgi:hypothetical protein